MCSVLFHVLPYVLHCCTCRLPKEDQTALHRNGTIKEGQEQVRHVSPLWSTGQQDEALEGIDGGSAHQMQEGGGEGSNKSWTTEPHHPRMSETSFGLEQSTSLHASFSTGFHPSEAAYVSKSCSPPAVLPVSLTMEGLEPVGYVNLEHARGRGIPKSPSEQLQKVGVKKKKKPVPIPRPAETQGYVNVEVPHHSRGPPTMPRDKSGYTPVLVHGEQVAHHAPGESCYDVPRSAGSLPHATALSTHFFSTEADTALHRSDAGKTHYAVPKGNTMKPGKIPPFVAPKPQTSGSNNNSVYDCPKGTPMQVFPASIGAPFFGSQYPEDAHGSGASQYDKPRPHPHQLVQRCESSGIYDAPRIHPVQHQKATSPPALTALRRESQYDVPRSPLQLHYGNGSPDVAEGYDSLARYPAAQLKSRPHSMFGSAQHHSAITGNPPTTFRLPPHPSVTAHSSSHNTGHYDVPRSPHGPPPRT